MRGGGGEEGKEEGGDDGTFQSKNQSTAMPESSAVSSTRIPSLGVATMPRGSSTMTAEAKRGDMGERERTGDGAGEEA